MRLTLIPLAVLVVAAGCGDPKPLDLATTPEASRAALTEALDGWKAGETDKAMAGRSPPLYLVDDDLTRGAKLVDYQLAGEPKVFGTGLSYPVTLTLQHKDRTTTRKAAYRVVTTPNRAVTREEGS
ncbi:MAG: hypothetical protein K2X87_03855 [Gemmataceae bacterium]|nr:hypothetical protein [Gemmataceae bacterium]